MTAWTHVCALAHGCVLCSVVCMCARLRVFFARLYKVVCVYVRFGVDAYVRVCPCMHVQVSVHRYVWFCVRECGCVHVYVRACACAHGYMWLSVRA